MDEPSEGQGVLFLGSHRVRFEEPDLCIFLINGEPLVPEIVELFDKLCQFSQGKPYLYLVMVLVKLDASAAARRAIAEHSKRLGPHMTLIVGAKFHERVIASLVESVVRFTTPQFGGIRFFQSEAEARAWVVEQRTLREQRMGP